MTSSSLLSPTSRSGFASRSAFTATSRIAASRQARLLRCLLAALGSAAIEEPVISWVADHRTHHAFCDRPGGPHTPHVDLGHGWLGELRGLAHAHVGWLFLHGQRAATERYASDLLADPVIRFVSTTSLLWVLLGLAVPLGPGSRSATRSRPV